MNLIDESLNYSCLFCKSANVEHVRDNTALISAVLPLEFVSDDDLLEGCPFTDLISPNWINEDLIICKNCGEIGLREAWEIETENPKTSY